MIVQEKNICKTYIIVTEKNKIEFEDELELIFDILNNVVNGNSFLVYENWLFTLEDKIHEYQYDITNRFIRMFREFIFQNILDRVFTRIGKEYGSFEK